MIGFFRKNNNNNNKNNDSITILQKYSNNESSSSSPSSAPAATAPHPKHDLLFTTVTSVQNSAGLPTAAGQCPGPHARYPWWPSPTSPMRSPVKLAAKKRM